MPPLTATHKSHRLPKVAPSPPAPKPHPSTVPPSPVGPHQLYKKFDHLSYKIESLQQHIADGHFTSTTSHRKVHSYMLYLKRLRAQVEDELTRTGYRRSMQISGPGAKQPVQAHKHKHRPTSPKYTVDKALKRKNSSFEADQPAWKKRKGSVESDFVETDCESDGERRKEDAGWGPVDPVTNLAQVPLEWREKEKMGRWRWKVAVRRGGVGVEQMISPMGGTFLW